MQVAQTTFTIAEYCDQLNAGGIVINHDYQRTDQVWPPAARSYLIDTILHGYPVPKMCLSQKTDLKSRKTIKEIVDGQQRTKAIKDFYEGELRIAGKSEFAGMTYEQLDGPIQQKFVDYTLSIDLFVGATEDDIRQVFRRMNSYTVPLNPQEQRHATHQGEFKWFIIQLTEKYAQALKTIGVFGEKQLSRMADAAFFTEVLMAILSGIETSGKTKLDSTYSKYDESFPREKEMLTRIDNAFAPILDWHDLHKSSLMKPFSFYSLILAITHCQRPCDKLSVTFEVDHALKSFDKDIVLANLTHLSSAVDEGNGHGSLSGFVKACSSATNTKSNRSTRFEWFCKALQPRLLK